MSPLDILLGKVDVAPVQPTAAAPQNSSGSKPFSQVFAQLFNSIQLNPQDLSRLANPISGPANLAAAGAENAVSDFLQALFQALDGSQGLSDELQSLLATLGIDVTDQGLQLAPDANPDQLSDLLNYLGLGLQEQNGAWVVLKDGQPVTLEEFIGILDEKRQAATVPQEAGRQASYENAKMDLASPVPAGEGTVEPAPNAETPAQPFTASGSQESSTPKAGIPLPDQKPVPQPEVSQAPTETANAGGSGEAQAPESADELEALKNEALKIAAQAKSEKSGTAAVPDGSKPQPAAVKAPESEVKPPLIDLSSKAGVEAEAADGARAAGSTDGDEQFAAAAGSSPKTQSTQADPQAKGLPWNPVPDASASRAPSATRSDVGGDLLNQGNTWSGMHLSVLTQSSETAEAGRTGAQTFTPSTDLGRDILHQIVDKARVQIGRKETRIEIQLKPEFLGKLRIEVGSKQGELSVAIYTENSAVKNVLESNLQALKDAFTQHGLRLENLQVAVDQQDLAQTASNPNGMAGEMAGGHESGHEREGHRRAFHETLDVPAGPESGFNRLLLDIGRVDLFA